jgi:hypothetical protein
VDGHHVPSERRRSPTEQYPSEPPRKKVADDQFELRYSNYITYNEVVEYNPIVTEIKDEFDYDSPEYSFGQGNLFEKP